MSARFRHEDVSAVPSGWKVRTVKAGSHRVRVAFPPGRKQKGSGRLVSVLHPTSGSNPCANPCSLRASNPAELMVMSANHPPRRRNAETKKEKQHAARERAAAIRAASGHNPKPVNGLHIKYSPVNAAYFLMWHGTILRVFQTKAEAKAEMEYLLRNSSSSNPQGFTCTHCGKVFTAAQVESGEFRKHMAAHRAGRNPAELLVMGANPNPRVEVVAAPNPPTEEIVEAFTGREVEFMDVYNEPHMPRGRYAKLGPLVALYIKPAKGGQVQRIGAAEAVGDAFPEAWGGKPPLVVCDSSARQIYFVDGHQDISSALAAFGAIDRGNGVVELGKGRRIDYQCRKEHVASPDEDLWKHEHGEEGGSLPTVLFDTRTKRILYEGGDYRIEGPWIRD